MPRWIRKAALEIYDFVVGDDWLLAVGVIVGLGLTALLAQATSVAAWWAAPLIVILCVAADEPYFEFPSGWSATVFTFERKDYDSIDIQCVSPA